MWLTSVPDICIVAVVMLSAGAIHLVYNAIYTYIHELVTAWTHLWFLCPQTVNLGTDISFFNEFSHSILRHLACARRLMNFLTIPVNQVLQRGCCRVNLWYPSHSNTCVQIYFAHKCSLFVWQKNTFGFIITSYHYLQDNMLCMGVQSIGLCTWHQYVLYICIKISHQRQLP